MVIWKITPTLEQLNQISQGSIHDSLGIEFTEVGESYLEAKMPVDSRTHNPVGILHGGASVVLAESLGSIASILVTGLGTGPVTGLAAGPKEFRAVGLEINASHLRSVKTGTVYGRATPVRIGKTIHVWNIQVRESENLDSPTVCICRLTVMIQLSGNQLP